MFIIHAGKNYRRSLKRLNKVKNFDLERLNDVINILASGQELPRIYLDHALTGDWIGRRECHVQNDLLLIYKIDKGQLLLIMVNIGSHAELF